MTKLEEQLLIYRAAQKARKEKEDREKMEAEEIRKANEAKEKKDSESSKQNGSSLLNFLLPSPPPPPPASVAQVGPRIAYFRDDDEDDGLMIDYIADDIEVDYDYMAEIEENREWTKKDVLIVMFKFLIYGGLQMLAIRAEWGAVFFIISLLYFIYYNTRTRRRLVGEPSAYSVFNDGCEPIDGAMEADRLVNQLAMGQIIL